MKCHERRAHRRTERITIQQLDADAATDAHGNPTRTWENIADPFRWARVTPKGSSEGEQADQVVAKTTVEIELGYDSVTAAIDPRNSILIRSQRYEIDAVRNLEMRNDVILVTGVLSE